MSDLALSESPRTDHSSAEWNRSQRPYSCDNSVPDLVSHYAFVNPESTAVVAGTVVLTYKELDRRANQLAHHLLALGVGPETPVGLCLKRSADLIIGALGIMKAGAAYLPLDLGDPDERLTLMLEDAKIPVLVTEQAIVGRLHGNWAAVALDSDLRQIERRPVVAPTVGFNPNHRAYLIYTSGSTGVPKAVQIGHRNLLNLVFWHQRAFAVTCDDRASFLAGPGFDAAVWELWPYLTAGASIHIPDETTRTTPEMLREWLLQQKISIAFVPTPMAEKLLSFSWPNNPSLRTMLTGGDRLHQYPASSIPFKVVNNYGPSECTVVATSGTVSTGARPDSLPPIGRPIDNTQLYILDENLHPVPLGVVGELYVGGAGVGCGYLNRPELSAERFLPDPFASEPTAKMYKTGDLGRYLPDGQVAFVGRIDQQVKIRGYRIELDEIAAVLNHHPLVRSSAVVALETGAGDKQLVAYVAPSNSSDPSKGSLQEFLKSRLPDYMVPAKFVRIEDLPVTSNGKVNRAALPPPSQENLLRDELVAPRNTIEDRVAEILSDLLKVGPVGLNDNFFLLGGHSLLGTQLIARVRKTFGVELSLRTLFENATVVDISAEIEKLMLAKLPRTNTQNSPVTDASGGQ